MDIIILGASGTAKELHECVSLSDHFNFLGFLDDFKQNPKVIGSLSDWNHQPPSSFLLSALGSYRSMSWRKSILDSIPIHHFTSYVDTTSLIYPSVNRKNALIVFPNSIVSTNTSLGQHNLIYHSCVIAHDCNIGNYSILSNSVTLSGAVSVGINTYIGAGSTIMEGVRIGTNSIIAAGATVISDVPDNSTYISEKKIIPNKYHKNE